MNPFKSFSGAVPLVFALPLLLGSCGQDSQADGSAPLEIRLSPSVCVVSTRAPFEALSDAPLQAHIYKSFTSGDYIGPDVYHEALTFSDGSALGFSVPQYFPSDDSPVYLCGYSPADALWTDQVYSDATRSTTVNRVLDGKTDLLACGQQSLTKSEALTSGAFRLGFEHLLTKLKIRAVADADAPYNPSDVWGAITKVELLSVGGTRPATTVSLDLVSGNAVYGAGSDPVSSPFPVYCMEGDDAYPGEESLFSEQERVIPTEVTDIAYSLVAPFTPTGEDDLLLKVYTGYFPQGVEAKVSLDSNGHTAGQTCVVTLTFSTGDKPIIQATSSVSFWQTGADTGSVLE